MDDRAAISVLLLARDETRDIETLIPTLAFAREVVVVWDPRGDLATREAAERLGWSTVWTTDHLLVATEDADDYGRIYEAILSLAWIGAKYSRVRLGTSVIVVPYRNAVVLAKELATLDALSGGRVMAGVGVGWSEPESSAATSRTSSTCFLGTIST